MSPKKKKYKTKENLAVTNSVTGVAALTTTSSHTQVSTNVTALRQNSQTPALDPQDRATDSTNSPKTFLDLYPEIRNMIYRILIDDGPPAVLRRRIPGVRKGNNICINSPMIVANKQISYEYISLARATTPNIDTIVLDMNFNHVIAFLGTLDMEVPFRNISILLSASKGKAKAIRHTSLLHWYRKMETLSPIEAKVEFFYEFDSKTFTTHPRRLLSLAEERIIKKLSVEAGGNLRNDRMDQEHKRIARALVIHLLLRLRAIVLGFA